MVNSVKLFVLEVNFLLKVLVSLKVIGRTKRRPEIVLLKMDFSGLAMSPNTIQ